MKKLAQVFHFDLYGKREDKYDFLKENSLATIAFTELNPQEPELFFVPKDFDSKSDYDEGFKVNELFKISSLGVQTHRDNFAISINKNEVKNRIIDFYNKAISNSDLINKYNLKETSEWKLNQKRDNNFDEKLILKIGYRPFDNQFIYNDKNIVDRLRDAVSKHIINKDNLCLVVSRQCVSDWRYIFLSKFIVESNLTSTAGRFGSGNFFPLYLYPETNAQQTLHGNIERTPNLNLEIVKQLADGLGLTFTNEKTTPPVGHPSNGGEFAHDGHPSSGGEFAPIDVLDYIYAVLHSPTYREKYAAFLKIDFPRVPYPKDKDTFWQLVKLGGEIRQIHLLESAVVDNYITQYPIDGDNIVVKPNYKNGNVYLNESQYFANVPEVAWNFYIGGYQPAQKWLKDRKGRELSTEDIFHYQKIIVALSETDRIMKEIDKIDF